MSEATPDIIDLLAGIEQGSLLDRLRSGRQQARDNAQKSFLALFQPAFETSFKPVERFAIASFVAGLHQQPIIEIFYARQISEQSASGDISTAIHAETNRGLTVGPYGDYPAGPLSVENKFGLLFKVDPHNRAILGDRLSSALEHAHLLVFRPRDADSQTLQRLLDAGWSTDETVTLSQLVSFLAFQIRVIAGLTVLATSAKQAAA